MYFQSIQVNGGSLNSNLISCFNKSFSSRIAGWKGIPVGPTCVIRHCLMWRVCSYVVIESPSVTFGPL